MSKRVRTALLSLTSVVALGSSVAFAAPVASSEPTAAPAPAPATAPANGDALQRADALFNEGKALMKAERYAEACPTFAASVAIDPGIGARLWLAECEARVGHVSSAYRKFSAAESLAVARRDPRASIASRRRAELEPHVARVSIASDGDSSASIADARVVCDGVEGDFTPWQKAAPLDAGTHSFVVRRHDGASWSTTVALVEGQSLVLRPTFVSVEPNVGPLAIDDMDRATDNDLPRMRHAAAASASEREPPGSSSSSVGSLRHTVGLATIAAGVVAVGAGFYLGVEARATYNDPMSTGHCNAANQCDADGLSDRAHASVLARDSTIFVVAGAASIVGGAVLALLPWGVHVAPTAGLREAGVAASGHF